MTDTKITDRRLLILPVLILVVFLSWHFLNRDAEKETEGFRGGVDGRGINNSQERMDADKLETLNPNKIVADRFASLREEEWPGQKAWVSQFPFTLQHSQNGYVFDKKLFEGVFPDSGPGGDNSHKRELYIDIIDEHIFIKRFFENPTRLSRGFAETVQILWEYGQGKTIEETTAVYNALHQYHNAKSQPGDKLFTTILGRPHTDINGDKITWGERAEEFRGTLAVTLQAIGTQKEEGGVPRTIDNSGKTHLRYTFEEGLKIADDIINRTNPEDFQSGNYGELFIHGFSEVSEMKEGEPLYQDIPIKNTDLIF